MRLLYTHPAHWSDELIETIAECDKVARYIDIPLQHIDESMLGRMRRETSRAHIEDLIHKLRAGIPGVTLRTTFIVGFPGETDAEFETLLDFIRRSRFERLGIFKYSQEEGSRAARMPGQVPAKIKNARYRAAMAMQQSIAHDLAREKIGSELKLLVDQPHIARSEADAPDVDARVVLAELRACWRVHSADRQRKPRLRSTGLTESHFPKQDWVVTSRRFLINFSNTKWPNLDQPKKETVRIQLPHPPVTKPSEPSVKPHKTVRIQLPVRETGTSPVPSPSQSATGSISSTNFFPPPKPPAASRPLSASVRPPPIPPPSGPKKETVRIPLTPEPLRSSQKKTQPLIAMPNVVSQNPPIAVAPVEKSSMLVYWMLLATSALILIIQIWTYFS